MYVRTRKPILNLEEINRMKERKKDGKRMKDKKNTNGGIKLKSKRL